MKEAATQNTYRTVTAFRKAFLPEGDAKEDKDQPTRRLTKETVARLRSRLQTAQFSK